MKSLQMTVVVLIIVLFLFEGSNVTTMNVCANPEPMPHCTEGKCNNLCVNKYSGNPKHQGEGARGYCVVPGTCTCVHPC